MTKESKKKKEKGKGKEQAEGEGIPLKVANEYRRTNRMEPLTKEQHDARKAVIWANKRAEEAVKKMRDQTNSDQTLSNTHEPQPTKANNVSVEEAVKVEAERLNLESARDFQCLANLKYYKEKADIESKRAEIENQTGLPHNPSTDLLPLTGKEESSDPNQTSSDLKRTPSDPNQTLSDTAETRRSAQIPNQTLVLAP